MMFVVNITLGSCIIDDMVLFPQVNVEANLAAYLNTTVAYVAGGAGSANVVTTPGNSSYYDVAFLIVLTASNPCF